MDSVGARGWGVMVVEGCVVVAGCNSHMGLHAGTGLQLRGIFTSGLFMFAGRWIFGLPGF